MLETASPYWGWLGSRMSVYCEAYSMIFSVPRLRTWIKTVISRDLSLSCWFKMNFPVSESFGPSSLRSRRSSCASWRRRRPPPRRPPSEPSRSLSDLWSYCYRFFVEKKENLCLGLSCPRMAGKQRSEMWPSGLEVLHALPWMEIWSDSYHLCFRIPLNYITVENVLFNWERHLLRVYLIKFWTCSY